MDCTTIQEKLTPYIEGIISSKEKRMIDEHLKSCHQCTETLADLRKTLTYIQNLEEIEPPSWLTRRVMAKVKSEVEPKKGMFQRLFYPLHIKLPIEAVAAIVIGVTTLYVFKAVHLEMKHDMYTEVPKTPSEEVISQIPSPPSPPLIEGMTSPPPTPSVKGIPSSASPPLTKGGKGGLLQKKKKDKALLEERKAFPSRSVKQPTPIKEPEVEHKNRRDLKEQQPVTQQDKVMPYKGSVAKNERKQEALPSGLRARALAGRKAASIHFTVYVKDITAAREEIGKEIVRLGGEKVKTESLENRNVIVAMLGYKKIKELLEKIKLIGEVKEDRVILENREGETGIRIEIMKTSNIKATDSPR